MIRLGVFIPTIMESALISLPQELAIRTRATIPNRRRSKTIVGLIENEVHKRAKMLEQCAMAVEMDHTLYREMQLWDVIRQDGLSDATW